MKNIFKRFFPKKETPHIEPQRTVIAIFEPDSNRALEKIRHGFISSLNKDESRNFIFNIHNPFGKREHIPAIIEEMFHEAPEFIFSIGTSCTKIIQDEIARTNNRIPVVFADVKDPVHAKFIDSFVYSGNHMTGVVSFTHDYLAHINYLLKLLPFTSKVLIVCDPSQEGGLINNEKNEILEYLRLIKIQGESIGITSKDTIGIQVSEYLKSNRPDVIVTLRDTTVMSGMADLVQISNTYRIPLYTFDLESVLAGATFGSGMSEREIGEKAADMIHQIIKDKHDPAYMPITLFHEQYRVRVNRIALAYLGIKLPKETVQWVQRNGEMV